MFKLYHDVTISVLFSSGFRGFIGSLYSENNVRVFKIGKKEDGTVGNIQTAFDFPSTCVS